MKPSKAHDRDPVEFLAEEFLEQHRQGKNPSIASYADRFPDLAHEIRELFPAVLAMERLKAHGEAPLRMRASLGAQKLERLGDFRLLSEIGRGGMGVVYDALHESLNRHVAVKVLPRQSDRQARSFLKEARMVARLHHSNIVPVFGVGEQDGYQYIVMQLIKGVDLEAVLSALRNLDSSLFPVPAEPDPRSSAAGEPPSGSVQFARALVETSSGKHTDSLFGLSPDTSSGADLPPLNSVPGNLATAKTRWKRWRGWPAAASRSRGPASGEETRSLGPHYWRRMAAIGRQAADALHYAHLQRTLHRDIKPANLILDGQGVVWITDFGLAKAMDESHGSHAGSLAGTLRFMAPEQFAGECDHRSDIYSLGLTLYELLTLRPAFLDDSRSNLIRKITEEEPISIRRLCPGVPKDLEAIVAKAMARNPADRYQTAGDLSSDLQRFLDDCPVIARPMSSLHRAWRWARRNRAVAATGAAAAIFLGTTAIFASAQYVQRTRALEIQSQLRAQADAERLRTEANLRLAAEAFDDVFGRVTGTPLTASLDGTVDEGPSNLNSGAMVNEREAAILEGLLSFYDAFAKQNENDMRWQRETARAFRRAGEIQYRLGNNQEANQSFIRALTIFERLASAAPTDADLLSKIAVTRNRLANIAWETGRADIALSESRRCWQDLLGRPASLESSPACRIELARAYNQYALAAQQFRFGNRFGGPSPHRRTDPREYLQRAVAIVDSLLSEYPDQLEYGLTMAESYRSLWWIETQRKHLSDAQQARERALAVLDELVQKAPDEPECRYMLAEVYLVPFRFAFDGQRETLNPRHADQSQQLAAALASEYPQVPKYQTLLAQSLVVQARLAEDAGTADRSLALFDQAVALQRTIVEKNPDRGRYHWELIRFLEDRLKLVRNHRSDERKNSLEALIAAVENVPENFQSFPPFVRSGSRAHSELAELLRASGDLDAAAAADAKARSLSEKLSGRNRRPDRPAEAR